MRRSSAWLLAAALALTACSKEEEAQIACPAAEVLQDLGEFVRFKPGPGRDATDVLVEAWIDGLGGQCVLDGDELAMLQSVLKVSETQAREAMIPRSHMVVLEREAPPEEILRTIVRCGHSRLPVIGEDRDEVVGILLAKDVLRHFVDAEGPLRPLPAPPRIGRGSDAA